MENDPKTIAQLRSEALDALLAVKDRPGDLGAQKALTAFIASGPDARRAYNEVASVWKAADHTRSRRTVRRRASWALAAVMTIAVVSSVFQPSWLGGADHIAGLRPLQVMLSSGTNVVLDAGTSLSHQTNVDGEVVNLLVGAAFFEVDKRERPLSILVGSLKVAVLGTAFDVSLIDGTAQVSVAEGQVEVTSPSGTVHLERGDRLRLARGAEHPLEDTIALEKIALWRNDSLLADKQPFAEVAEALDRRISGPVFITDGSLAEKRLTGAFTLSEPLMALELAARASGGRVLSYPWLTIVTAD